MIIWFLLGYLRTNNAPKAKTHARITPFKIVASAPHGSAQRDTTWEAGIAAVDRHVPRHREGQGPANDRDVLRHL
jgi:hypothetical protein